MQREAKASWPDDRLVAACRKGDQQAWAALVDKYKNLIFSIPIKLGLYDDAADIFQAVCLDLLTDLPRLREPRALPKWLMQTCYHKCLQAQRRAEKNIPLAEEDGETPAEGGVPSTLPDDMLVQLKRNRWSAMQSRNYHRDASGWSACCSLKRRLVPTRKSHGNSASQQDRLDSFVD